MELKCGSIILRDMVEADIEDYVRWFTTETAWAEFDAPWEPIDPDTDPETEREGWMKYYGSVMGLPENVLRWKFEIEYNGRHIGWVSSYMIDENYEWISTSDIKDGQRVYRAVGIDICESGAWGKGAGTAALGRFIGYYFDHGVDTIHTQTWSGNTRMIRCGEKLGFAECRRIPGIREVNGQAYDALTFKLDKP